MKSSLRTVKQKSLLFYKKQYEDNKERGDRVTLNYIRQCIDVLESDLKNGNNETNEYYTTEEKNVLELQLLGLSRHQAVIMDLLLKNKKVIISKVYLNLKFARTEIYNNMTMLKKMGLVNIIPSFPRTATLASPDKPLELLIDKKSKEVETMRQTIETLYSRYDT